MPPNGSQVDAGAAEPHLPAANPLAALALTLRSVAEKANGVGMPTPLDPLRQAWLACERAIDTAVAEARTAA